MDGIMAMQQQWNDPMAMDDLTAMAMNGSAMDGSAMDGAMAWHGWFYGNMAAMDIVTATGC
jgi:hypothetical protein